MSAFKFFKISLPAPFVAHVEINRPEKLNAFFDPMWGELQAVFESLSVNPDVRCILFSGAGSRAFTAGLDVTQAASPTSPLRATGLDPARQAFFLRRHILDLQAAVSSLESCQKPVITLMHGFAYGLGIDLSSAADIRLCSADTKFCVKEVDIGLAADVGTLSRLPKVLGGVTSWCKDICLTARQFSAEEALKHGLVSQVLLNKEELVKKGIEIANTIASKSPVAVQGTKNILNEAWGRSVAENLNYTAVWNAGMLQTSDVARAMTGGMKKQQPRFEKL
ncbi:MAG: hypothetical protein Q9160_001507 [Pyrenula sp. 1 TL-2023]